MPWSARTGTSTQAELMSTHKTNTHKTKQHGKVRRRRERGGVDGGGGESLDGGSWNHRVVMLTAVVLCV